LRRIVEEIKNNNLNAALVFIDFKKAFDTVHRGKMLDILRAYGVPEKLVAAIGHTYQQSKAHVTSPDGITKDFEIHAGVLQGDTFSTVFVHNHPRLCTEEGINGKEEQLGFTLVPRQTRRIGPQTITDLDSSQPTLLSLLTTYGMQRNYYIL
tara:strand:- start:378 stop:833 length:456 start_codon:yes stop_codon:yes gene_type:complete